MPPRPFYRRKRLWLGIMALLFLGAVWLRSIFYSDYLFVGPLHITNSGGQISSTWASLSDWTVHVAAFPDPTRRLGISSPACFFEASSSSIIVSFAHWFVILVAFLCWINLLVWNSLKPSA
jgi:hypothetical protein